MDGQVIPTKVGALPVGLIGGKTNWDEALSPLKSYKGEWFSLREFETSALAHCTRRNLTMNLYKSFPKGKWDFAVRRLQEGKWTLFGVFLGEEDE